jgi:hypothetical protein
MRSSIAIRNFNYQWNWSPGFNPIILRHSGGRLSSVEEISQNGCGLFLDTKKEQQQSIAEL